MVSHIIIKCINKTYYFKGKIDRIELNSYGNILVVDYKTGSVPALKDILSGKKLQLPVYLKAAEYFLSRQKAVQSAGGAYYLMTIPLEKKIVFCDSEAEIASGINLNRAQLPNRYATINDQEITLTELIEHTLSNAIGYIEQIKSGLFSHTTDSKECLRCPYREACRLNPAKQGMLARKPAD